MALVEIINKTLTKNENAFVYLSLILAAITSMLLFDVKVSLSGDDCDYIVAAGEFWRNFSYPGHHGPLYPIIISPFVGIFGVKIILLKLISTVFIISSLWLFYKCFQNIVPVIVLIPALILVSINPYVMFFSSYTYSEPLFLFMQSLFFYFFSKYFWKSTQEYSIKIDWKKYLILALIILGMGLTRTIGFCAIGVIILYFIIERRWKNLTYMTCIFTIIFGLFYFAKPIIWPNSGTVQSFETLFAKNPYNVEQGAEDIPGLIKRVTENSHIYLSGFLFKYFGFRDSSDLPLKDIPILSILSYILFAVCFITTFKKNRAILFTGLYAGSLLFISFILLHKMWSQDRIIMVYYPYILLFLIGGFYYLFTETVLKKASFIFPLALASLIIGTSIHAKNRIGRHIPILQQNILGNDLYGLTPDWENFVKMSRWANDNLEKDAVIASRKPTISYVYTGRDFHGIFNVPYENINDIVKQKEEESGNNTFLAIELPPNDNILDALDSFMQYIFITKQGGSFSINNKPIKGAFVYKIEKSLITEELTNFLNANNINYSFDYDNFLKQYVDDNSILYQIANPDALLKGMTNSKIKYLILAKIRRYTSENTGLFVNTIHQHITFIQYKYSGRFRLIHTIGKDETCELVEFLGE